MLYFCLIFTLVINLHRCNLIFLVLFVFAVPTFLANKHWVLIVTFSLQLTIQVILAPMIIFFELLLLCSMSN